jgi:hypothetical protein
MSTDTTGASNAHPAAAPAIPTRSEEPANEPLPYEITGAAADLAILLRSIRHLAHALDSAVDDLDFSSESTNETAERILTFSRVIDSHADHGTVVAEKIEMAAYAANREARTAEPRPVAADREWKRVLLAFNVAKVRLEEHCAIRDTSECGSPENLAHEATTAKLADAFDEAATRLLLTEAPDPEALQFKLDLLASSELTDSIWTKRAEFARQVAKDGQRLLGVSAASLVEEA